MQYSNESNGSKKEPREDSEEDKRDNIAYWLKWIKDAKDNKRAKRHRKESRAAWDEYELEKGAMDEGASLEDSVPYCYPAYWSSCKTLEPAYFGRVPKTRARRKDGVDDAIALLAAKLGKRRGEYIAETSDYGSALFKAVQEYIHADKSSIQICVEDETQRVNARVELLPDSEIPEGVEVLQDEMGAYYEQVQEVVKPRIYFKAVLSKEVIHTPHAKSWAEVRELGYSFVLSKEDAEKRFALAKHPVKWKHGAESKDDDDESAAMQGKYIDGWEIYCKDTRKIYWVSPDCCPSQVLDIREDEWELEGFFPSSEFVIGSPPAEHLYPTPAHRHLAPTIEQLHLMYDRVKSLIEGVDRKALIDGGFPELAQMFDRLGGRRFIAVDNLQTLLEKSRGLENLVWYAPVAELVTAITELIQLDGFFSSKFDLFFGIPDILRGVSDPLTTASAEQIASGAAHDRFKWQKAQITKMASKALEMGVDLMSKLFDGERLARIDRYHYLTPEEQALYPQAIALLNNDEERLVRVEIESDSMSFPDEVRENQERNAVVQTVNGGLKEVSAMLANGQPEFAAVTLHSTLHALEGLKGGEEFIEEVKTYSQQLIEKAMNPPEQPPPPDYEQMKLELQSQKIQLDAQSKSRELDQREFSLQLEAQAAQQESAVKAQFEQFRIALEQQKQQFTEMIQAAYLELDRQKAQAAAMESVAEEQRLAVEAEAKLIEAAKPNEPAEPKSGGGSPQVAVVINEAPKPVIPIL